LPINAEFRDPKPNRDKTPGVSIGARQASIIIGEFNQMKPVSADAKWVEFEVQLEKGPTSLLTAFYDEVLNERGAYYVYVERL
jgi:hypothetical protein